MKQTVNISKEAMTDVRTTAAVLMSWEMTESQQIVSRGQRQKSLG